MEIIVKKYEHYNRALGKYIKSKRHYYTELDKGGYIPYEKAQQIAESKRNKEWKPSKELVQKLNYIKTCKCDKKGNIKHPKDLVGLYQKSGMKMNVPDWCPSHYKEV